MRNTYGIKIKCQPQKIREFVDDFSTSKIPRVWLSDFYTSKNLEVRCQDFSTSKIPRVWLSDFWKSWSTVTLSNFQWEKLVNGHTFTLSVGKWDQGSHFPTLDGKSWSTLTLSHFRWQSVKFLGQIFGACFCLLAKFRERLCLTGSTSLLQTSRILVLVHVFLS